MSLSEIGKNSYKILLDREVFYKKFQKAVHHEDTSKDSID